MAHGRERGVAAAERRLRRLLRLPLRLRHVHRVARPVLLPRDRLQRGAHRAGSRTSRSTSASCTRRKGGDARERRGGHDPGALAARRQVGRLLARLPPPHGRSERRSRGSSTTAPVARTSTTTRTSGSSARRRRSTRTRTRSSSSTTSSAAWSPSSRRPASSRTRSSSSSSDNGPEMETWPDAAYSPFRSAKGSTWEGGQRVPGIVVVAGDDRRRPRVATACSR